MLTHTYLFQLQVFQVQLPPLMNGNVSVAGK